VSYQRRRSPYSARRDDSAFVVFSFGKPEHAESFAQHFDGERLTTSSGAVALKTSRRPDCAAHDERNVQNVIVAMDGGRPKSATCPAL